MIGAMLSVAKVKMACKYMSGWVCSVSTMSVGSVMFAIEISLASRELWQRDPSAMYMWGSPNTLVLFSGRCLQQTGQLFRWMMDRCFSLEHPVIHGFKGGSHSSHSSCWKITVDASKSGTFAYASK